MSASSRRLTLSDRWFVVRRALVAFWIQSGPDHGAKLTYFTLLAFAPTLLAVYSLSTLVLANNQDLVQSITDGFIDSYVLTEYRDLAGSIVIMVTGSAAGGIVGLIASVVISLFSASAYVRAFARSSNDFFGVREGRNIVRLWAAMWLVTVVLVVGAVVILASLTLSAVVVEAVLGPIAGFLRLQGLLTTLVDGFLPFWAWAKWPVVLVVALVMLDVLYHFTPNVQLPKFRWLSLGSLLGVLGIALVGGLFAGYVSLFGGASSYGALGTVLAAMFATWGMNIAVVLGFIVDAEAEKFRQRKTGEWVAEDDLGASGGSGSGVSAESGSGASSGGTDAARPATGTFAVPVRADAGIQFQNRVQGRLGEEEERRLGAGE